MNTKTCIIICGPTAVGKTSYALELAVRHDTQIISSDSRQCYKELNIGVAKPTAEQLGQVKHFFIDSHSIHEEVNAKIFEQYAIHAVNEIFKKSDVAVMVGGTGLYVRTFMEGLDEIPEIKDSVRKEISDEYRKKGFEWLRDALKKNDPVFYEGGEMQNPQRMLRALEVKVSTGKSIFEFHSKRTIKRDFEIETVLLGLPREQLYHNINFRVDQMMEQGLLKEAEHLYPFRHLNALQTVGYKELFDFFDEKISLENAVEEIKKNTRHYAKRQMTWFKKNI